MVWNPGIVREMPRPDPKKPVNPTPGEKALLRRLAARAREIAELPEMDERKGLWRNHNALRSERPMLLADPEGAWQELVPTSDLECEDPKLRLWELELRRKVFWYEHIHDDDTVEPYFDIPWHVTIGDFGVKPERTRAANRGSYVWEPALKDLEGDIGKLHYRELSVDRDSTHADVELADSIFGDLLPSRIRGKYWWSVGLTRVLVDFVGLGNMMLYTIDRPELLHHLMGWLRDERLHFLEWFEHEGLLTDTNGNDYVGSGGLAYTDELPRPDRKEGEKVRLKDTWGFAESQVTIGISPKMFAEFVFPYQRPVLEEFGLTCYGCCEPVHDCFDCIARLSNLRRVSVCAWADEQLCADKIGGRYIYSRKPNPAMICVSFDEDAIRENLRKTLTVAGECNLEFNMKDTHTVQNQPWRITRWVQIAKEEIDRHMAC